MINENILAAPEPVYLSTHRIPAKGSSIPLTTGLNTSTPTLPSSEGQESPRAGESVFSRSSGSKRSSRSTSILLNGIDDSQENADVHFEGQRVPFILLNGHPLDLDVLGEGSGSFPARKARRSYQASPSPDITSLSPDIIEPSTSATSPSLATYQTPTSSSAVDPFRFPRSPSPTPTHPSSTEQPLTPTLLISLAPTLLKWRTFTFYSAFFPSSLQKRLADDAFACLVLKVSQINSVDWGMTWSQSQVEREQPTSGLVLFGWLRGSRVSTRSSSSSSPSSSPNNGSGRGNVSNVITAASKTLNIPAIQLELAIEGIARASDPKLRNLTAKSLADMKEWDLLARILLTDGELLSAATPTSTTRPKSVPRPTPIPRPRKVKLHGTTKDSTNPESRTKTKGTCRAVTTPTSHLSPFHVQAQEAYALLTPLLPTFRAAHRNARQQYFKAVEWDGRDCCCGCADGFGLSRCFQEGGVFRFRPCFGSCFGSTSDRRSRFGSGVGNDVFPATGMGIGGGARSGKERWVSYKLSNEEEGDQAAQQSLETEMRAAGSAMGR